MPCKFPLASKQVLGCSPTLSTYTDPEPESIVAEKDVCRDDDLKFKLSRLPKTSESSLSFKCHIELGSSSHLNAIFVQNSPYSLAHIISGASFTRTFDSALAGSTAPVATTTSSWTFSDHMCRCRKPRRPWKTVLESRRVRKLSIAVIEHILAFF